MFKNMTLEISLKNEIERVEAITNLEKLLLSFNMQDRQIDTADSIDIVNGIIEGVKNFEVGGHNTKLIIEIGNFDEKEKENE